jgi:hypothetical protein
MVVDQKKTKVDNKDRDKTVQVVSLKDFFVKKKVIVDKAKMEKNYFAKLWVMEN